MIIKRKHGFWIVWLKTGEYITYTEYDIPLQVKSKEKAIKIINNIIKTVKHINKSKDRIENPKLYLAIPSRYHSENYYKTRLELYPFNKSLLIDKPQLHEFELVEVNVDFMKLNKPLPHKNVLNNLLVLGTDPTQYYRW